jgi:S-adenosylmethionine synthetase
MIFVLGEVTTRAHLDYPNIIRSTIKKIGYDHSDKGFDYKTCNVLLAVEGQSPEIAEGVHLGRGLEEMGAGDQVRSALLPFCAITIYGG